jgi:hypothetical protein
MAATRLAEMLEDRGWLKSGEKTCGSRKKKGDQSLKVFFQTGFFVILNEVKDLNFLKMRDSSLRSE